ncbi:MAG TPA: ROK family protein, partial [Bacteroidetes bacterium]|nr:ROK family protein [Bacteroidota bacterium]
ELSRRYNISRAAVSDIVSRLIKRDFIREIGPGVSSDKGGRKPVMLSFNEKAGYIIGVELRKSHFRVAVCDLYANILSICRKSFSAHQEGEKLIQQVVDAIHRLIGKEKIRPEQLFGIGIGIPGLVDVKRGVLTEAHSVKPWRGLELKEIFKKCCSSYVYVDNDIKMAAIGEFVFGQKRQMNNMIFIGVGEGIGAGFIIDGKIHRGITYSAGEIGYDELGYFLKEKEKFPLLFHGQQYFGDVLSYHNLLHSFEIAVYNGYETTLAAQDVPLQITDILQAAVKGDDLCRKILAEYAHLLSILSINLINYLNPELVVFNGEIFEHSNWLLDLIKQRVQKNILHLPAAKVKIQSSVTKKESGMKGAVGLVLEDLFEPPFIDTRKYRKAFVK